ncbi:MAG: sugar transferase [Ruminococcus flavefaciens]|nr:sugar transferase [Ruminococcus flavefaciens]MCM1230523.1 sugar transferase [Ruminococcus flavefaciens]
MITTGDLTKEERWRIADRLASDVLPVINPTLDEVKPKNSFYVKYVKRFLDIIISLIVLIITLPLNLIIAVITFFDVGRPIFFFQERLGKGGKLFKIVKFRNMRNTVDENGELLPPAQRVTKIGKFMRKYSLDEFLNFWSILKGDMSLIGPRPLLPEHYNRYNQRHLNRLAVRPGLECPPPTVKHQMFSWQDRFENDVWYVENASFLLDCKLVINVVRIALDRKSAAARADVSRGMFMGYNLEGTAITLDEVPQKYLDEIEIDRKVNV